MRITRWKPLALLVSALPLALVQVPVTASAEPPTVAAQSGAPVAAPGDDYYQGALGKTGEQLKVALHQIISNSDKLTYSQVKEALKTTDQDPNSPANVVLLYSGRSQGGDDGWNREHVWAKSHGDFGTAPGPGTDVHHLRPTDVAVNSERGNKDFDMGGSEVGGAPGNFTDDDSWEPRNEVKGDVARMILYMAVRYEGDDNFADLEPNDQVDNGKAPFIGRLSVLRQWSAQDPPDAFEQKRNQVIYDQFQHNRNPFVDHPEWVNEIWK